MSSIDLEIDSLSSLLDDMTKNDPFKARVRGRIVGKAGAQKERRGWKERVTAFSKCGSPRPCSFAGIIWICTPTSCHSICSQA